MQIRIDHSSARPVYQQIVDHIKRDIALGRLHKDEKLPTVRELAAQLAINPNTIAKAYRQLEREGIIVTKPGSGAFVAGLDRGLSMSMRKELICRDLERTIIEAVHMRIEENALIDWFNKGVQKFKFHDRKDE
ncbi:MAG: GntR family transcriptional regulator [Chloroflexi bacterium]|nr:MAG: GntR family transcriptional regulator [Chloroflexota bacterium]